MKHLKGSLLLLLAAFFWGTSFAAQTSAADTISPFAFNGARSLIGSLPLRAGERDACRIPDGFARDAYVMHAWRL